MQNTKTEVSSSVDTTPLNYQPSSERTTGASDFEVAIEATAVGDDSGSLGSLADAKLAEMDPSQSNGNVEETSDLTTEEHRHAESDSGSVGSEPLHPTQIESASISRLQSPLQSRTTGAKGNAVAAADIHALLDSFAPTGNTTLIAEIPQSKSLPKPRDSSPELIDQNSAQGDSEPPKEKPTFDLDMETHDVYHTDPVAQSGPNVHGLKNGDSNDDNVDDMSARNRGRISSKEPMPSLSPGLHAPSRQQLEPAIRPQRIQHNRSVPFIWPYLVPLLLLLSVSLYLLSSFLLGLACGFAIVYCFFVLRHMILGDNSLLRGTKCPVSGSPLGPYCCSLHSQLTRGVGIKGLCWPIYAPALPPLGPARDLPQLRDLQSLTVPHMSDEDPRSSAACGPLGVGLGFKLNKNERPVYKGWMNETSSYDAQTHHVSQTHSVFVTLDGTQLRLQRPRRNIARRSMWNEELPTTSALRFHQQRIFDLVHARVTLLPTGLVSKRLWSKKYPISITIPKKLHGASGSRQSLSSSTSVPNVISACIVSPSTPTRTDTATSPLNIIHSHRCSPTPADVPNVVDDFTIISQHDVSTETLYLFGRTCREKETWYARLRAASLGIPLLWTPQLLPPFISDLIVVGIDLGTELPVIRRIGRPFLDAHGLWFELDVAYTGGFSVALETNVNLMRWNQKSRESNMLADDLSSISPPSTTQTDQNMNSFMRRSNRLGAFLSEEEDSADSTTDSDTVVEPVQPLVGGNNNPSASSLRRSSGSGRLPSSSPGLVNLSGRNIEEDRTISADSPLTLPAALPSRRRLIRIVDRITRSTYFQRAVDNKLVQRGMELLSNTPIVLEAEIQMLTGTLLINIPPPPSDRLWYGFRPNPQLRLKARPRVGEKAVTMSRILEWIEKRVALEFQRLIVLPNMDDISIPLLLSDISAG
ncbi:Testis-expressed sequence 2 protein [Fasciola gigantica]|uniref:Testis-expressed sequence 2 protein n=1 Tax=Fasciola gigantica TaxID=46835 RepID=A0A504YT97_FASGI|nr:Testis-expressed sequence 2 protein [Fasciola gigantica]